MATRRRARQLSLTTAMSDVRQRLQYLEARPSRSRIAAYAIRRTNVQPRAISTDQMDFQSVTTDIIDDDAVTNDKMAVNSVGSAQIQEGAITNPGLDGGSVDSRVLDDDSVLARHIKNGEVKEDELATDAVTRGKIKDGEVIESKLATDAVTRGKIKDLEVIEGKLAQNAVTRDKIKDLEVIEGKLAQNAVTRDKIKDGEVIQGKLGQGAVRRDNIDTRAVTNIKIEDGTIARGKLAFNTVTNVRAGDGLEGGGEVREPQLKVDSSVSRVGHAHGQYSLTSHTHSYASVNHTHSGNTTGTIGGAVPGHTHTISGLGNVSSRTLKKDIEDYSIDPRKVLKLNLKKFRYLNHARKYQKNLGNRDWNYGYIAEEVLDSGLEELLIYDDQGKPFGLNYGLVGVLSLELVRSLYEKVETLEQRVLKLERGL